ncbi:MAG: DNA repair protein RecN [bacterium]|nr:DNA repair protein RecN [Candidatus Sumerlaeota bacterium]
MLDFLRIANYAVIEALDAEFAPGLTVITGETGAGKSIIIGALRLALGERVSGDVIRAGAERAMIEAVFSPLTDEMAAWASAGGFESDDGESRLMIRREITASGLTRNFINNRSATAAQLREIGGLIIDFHGQGEHTSLYSPVIQMRLLDSYGGHTKALDAYRAAYAEYRNVLSRLNQLQSSHDGSERRKSFLEFQIEEIASAALKPGEDVQLETELRRLQNAERLGIACATACDLLYEGEQSGASANALIASVAKALADAAALDPSQEELAARATELRFTVEDLASRVRDYAASVTVDPLRLTEVDERLHLIRSLKKKYGASIGEILAAHDALKGELQELENFDEALAQTQERCDAAGAAALAAAGRLSAARIKAAKDFGQQVGKVMQELEMPKAGFHVQIKSDSGSDPVRLGATGADEIEFLVALNPGEQARPMRKVASGGEMSRIMLAIKSVLAERDAIPTLIFDEIDAGISGDAATCVAEKMQALGESHQVLCITHLAQIAARGDHHAVVEKKVANGRTYISMEFLPNAVRAEAIARMLSGKCADDISLRFAKSLLKQK